MRTKMSSVVHFEMPADDTKRMSDFYAKAFGWNATFMGAEVGNYVMVQTGETHESGLPTEPGRINGGFYQRTAEQPNPSLVISVENLQEAMKEVEKAGGTLLGKPEEIPGIGMFISFTDTEGNRVGMLEMPSEMK